MVQQASRPGHAQASRPGGHSGIATRRHSGIATRRHSGIATRRRGLPRCVVATKACDTRGLCRGRGRSAEAAFVRSPETTGPSHYRNTEPSTRWLEACSTLAAGAECSRPRRDGPDLPPELRSAERASRGLELGRSRENRVDLTRQRAGLLGRRRHIRQRRLQPGRPQLDQIEPQVA